MESFCRYRRALMGALSSMESISLRSGRVLTESAHKEFERSYLVFRASLNFLARRAFEMKVLRYHFRPKLHQLGHLVYHFLPRNPRYMSCYSDEDYVARTKRLAEKCHPRYVSQQTCFRYAVHMCLKWSGHVQWRWGKRKWAIEVKRC